MNIYVSFVIVSRLFSLNKISLNLIFHLFDRKEKNKRHCSWCWSIDNQQIIPSFRTRSNTDNRIWSTPIQTAKLFKKKKKTNFYFYQTISVILFLSLLLVYLIVNEFDCPIFFVKPTKTSPLSFSKATLFKSLLVVILQITSVMPCNVC